MGGGSLSKDGRVVSSKGGVGFPFTAVETKGVTDCRPLPKPQRDTELLHQHPSSTVPGVRGSPAGEERKPRRGVRKGFDTVEAKG